MIVEVVKNKNFDDHFTFISLNKNQKWDPLRAAKTFIRRKVGHTT